VASRRHCAKCIYQKTVTKAPALWVLSGAGAAQQNVTRQNQVNKKCKTIYSSQAQATLDDFKEFQDAGITHPDMEKIKALLTNKTEVR
jgi:hypothetical protein